MTNRGGGPVPGVVAAADAPGRRRVRPVTPLSKDELTFFVPILLVNELNVREAHWRPRHIRARTHRDATALAVLQALRTGGQRWEIEAPPEQPKSVQIVAHVRRLFDAHENLRAACKHLVDGLQDAGLIQDDGPHTGHLFEYSQLVDRRRLGAEVTVRLIQPGVTLRVELAHGHEEGACP